VNRIQINKRQLKNVGFPLLFSVWGIPMYQFVPVIANEDLMGINYRYFILGHIDNNNKWALATALCSSINAFLSMLEISHTF